MSGTDYTQTTNLGLYKPLPNADINQWGSHLNLNADLLDSMLHSYGVGPFLPLSGGTLTSTMAGTTQAGAVWLNSSAVGSGVNGPATTQIALAIVHQKENYLTTATVGEIDCLYITGRQGGPTSDIGGLVVDVGSTGSGFTAILEGVSHQMAPTTGTISRSIRCQIGSINPVPATYQGIYLMAETGTSTTALYISDTPGSGQWTNFIEGWQNNNQNFIVTGTGGVYAAGGIQTGASGQVNVTGHLPVSTPGSYLAYNRASNGTTYLLTNRGGGSSGGFQFADVTNSDVLNPLLALFSTGVYFQTIPVFFSTGAPIHMPSDLVNAANDAAAGVAGVPVGVMYRNGSALMTRVV